MAKSAQSVEEERINAIAREQKIIINQLLHRFILKAV